MKSIYDSAWHHPFVAYVVGLGLLWAIARRLPFLYAYLVVFLVEILADACATGGWSPIPLGTTAYTVFSVVFIVLGDFRYFVLAERVTRPDEPLVRALRFATPISLVIPVVTGVMTRTIPAMRDDRVLYAVYESAMTVLVLALAHRRFGRRAVDEASIRWIREVSYLFAGLYAGWAACDMLILAGFDFAHVLRIVPNVAYYGAFLPFVLWRAPASWKDVRTAG
ncbi:MAG: hypothetical protein U0230_10495 [Polyangiales bacterium]